MLICNSDYLLNYYLISIRLSIKTHGDMKCFLGEKTLIFHNFFFLYFNIFCLLYITKSLNMEMKILFAFLLLVISVYF